MILRQLSHKYGPAMKIPRLSPSDASVAYQEEMANFNFLGCFIIKRYRVWGNNNLYTIHTGADHPAA